MRAGRKVEDRRGDEGGIELSGTHRTHIRDRPGRRLRHGQNAGHTAGQIALARRRPRRAADRRGEALTDSEIFVARAPRADLEKRDALGRLLMARRRTQIGKEGEREHRETGKAECHRPGGKMAGRVAERFRHSP